MVFFEKDDTVIPFSDAVLKEMVIYKPELFSIGQLVSYVPLAKLNSSCILEIFIFFQFVKVYIIEKSKAIKYKSRKSS